MKQKNKIKQKNQKLSESDKNISCQPKRKILTESMKTLDIITIKGFRLSNRKLFYELEEMKKQ